MAHPKLETVRQRYGGRCGYCGVTEIDAGAELTVDHYRPSSAGGDEADDNLIYACTKCNLYKGEFSPSTDDLLIGRRVRTRCWTIWECTLEKKRQESLRRSRKPVDSTPPFFI